MGIGAEPVQIGGGPIYTKSGYILGNQISRSRGVVRNEKLGHAIRTKGHGEYICGEEINWLMDLCAILMQMGRW